MFYVADFAIEKRSKMGAIRHSKVHVISCRSLSGHPMSVAVGATGHERWYRSPRQSACRHRPADASWAWAFILEGNIGKVIEKSVHSEMSGSPSRKPGVRSPARRSPRCLGTLRLSDDVFIRQGRAAAPAISLFSDPPFGPMKHNIPYGT